MMFRKATRTVRVVIVVALAMLATVGLAGNASAHATLIGSDPADGATLQAAPTTVTLTFDDSLENFEPLVTVTGPDGNQYQSGPADIDGAILSSAVTPLTAPGSYTIAYRVVSDDGHPVEGQVRFELAAPAGAAPGGAAPSSTAAAPPAGSSPVSASAANSAVNSAVPSTATSSGAPPAAGQTTEPPAQSSGSWSTWNVILIAAVVLIASSVSIIVRRRMVAGAKARSVDGPDERPGR